MDEYMADKCRNAGIDPKTVYGYKGHHPELSLQSVLDFYIKNPNAKRLKKRCKELSIGYAPIMYIQVTNPNISIDKAIDIYAHTDAAPLTLKCYINGISYNKAKRYKQRHPDVTDDEIINIYKEKEEEGESFNDKCRKLGINPKNASRYREKYPDLTDEEVFSFYLDERPETFADRCKKEGVYYASAASYKNKHPEKSWDEVIEYCKTKMRKQNILELKPGMVFKNTMGFDFEILEYNTQRDIKIKFLADGIVREHIAITRNSIKNGRVSVAYPAFSSRHNSKDFHGFTAKYLTEMNEEPYFSCTCNKCGFKGILKTKDIIEHENSHKIS